MNASKQPSWPIAVSARCKTCGYDLRSVAESKCPECGLPFNANDPTTFLQRAESGRGYLAWNTAALLVLVVPFFFVEFGTSIYIYTSLLAVLIVAAGLWSYRRIVLLKHPWISNSVSLWAGAIIAALVISIAATLLLLLYSLARAQ